MDLTNVNEPFKRTAKERGVNMEGWTKVSERHPEMVDGRARPIYMKLEGGTVIRGNYFMNGKEHIYNSYGEVKGVVAWKYWD